MAEKISHSWFVRKDLDGFFGLMIDNLMQLIVIAALCQSICGIPATFVFRTIIPGAAISIIFGNLFYAWQARRLAIKEGRNDVTALPYGINTVSLFAYIFFIMLPVKLETGSSDLAWKVGVLACIGSGIIEFLGAFIAEFIRKNSPRAALLSALAGIAITFISMDFALRIFNRPLVAFLPLGIILIEYFSHFRFPLRFPGGLVALIIGTSLAWFLNAFGFNYMNQAAVTQSLAEFQLTFPRFFFGEIWGILTSKYALQYISIIFPMGLFSVIGSLQNIESAKAAGDSYDTRSSLIVDGIGSIIAGCFGSCFPTTIYIGHPGWKALGARVGYSIINGFFVVFICLTGLVNLIFNIIPIEAGAPIVLWIGIVITAQAFQSIPREHAPAAAFGLFPAVAAYAITVMGTAIRVSGETWSSLGIVAFTKANFFIHGMISLERGSLLNSMIIAAIVVFVIEREFCRAALWALLASVLSFFGIIHSYAIASGGIISIFGINCAPQFSIGYAMMGVLFLLAHFLRKYHPQEL